jgi:hypothetical protein
VLIRRAALQHLKDKQAAAAAAAKQQPSVAENGSKAKKSVNGDDDGVNEDDEDDDDEEDDDGDAAVQEGNNKPTQAAAAVAASSLDAVDPEQFVQQCSIGRNCFELLGYDLLLTDDGRPIVMEVNHGPSLETGAAIDTRIKSQVLSDLFRHISVFLPDCRKPALRTRRYLQRVVKRSPDADLALSPPTGFRVVYPLREPHRSAEEAALADEYCRAAAALSQSTNQQQQQQRTPTIRKNGSFSFGSATAASNALPPIVEKKATAAAVSKTRSFSLPAAATQSRPKK